MESLAQVNLAMENLLLDKLSPLMGSQRLFQDS
jgi:hypothetical protein